MKKTSLIFTLLFMPFLLTGCQYEAIISTSDAKNQLTNIYATQIANDKPLSFTIDEVSVNSSKKDETTENGYYQYIVDEANAYYYYHAHTVDDDDNVTMDYEYFVFFKDSQYYFAINRLNSDNQYDKFYYSYQESDASAEKKFNSIISSENEVYQGANYQSLLLDEESGLLANNVNLDYTYFDLQTTSSGDDSLTVKYRLIDQDDNTIVMKISWKDYYLSYAEYQYSNDNDYLKTTSNFSNKALLTYPDLSQYSLNNQS